MIMQANIKVMNNVDMGFDALWVDKNTCHNTITLHIPQPDDHPLGKGTFKVIELNASELLEFMVRTQLGAQLFYNETKAA